MSKEKQFQPEDIAVMGTAVDQQMPRHGLDAGATRKLPKMRQRGLVRPPIPVQIQGLAANC